MFAADLRPKLKGIERADSLAFDFHKWGQVPYDAGFVLVRDGVLHRKTFETSAPYLRKELRGLAAGPPWPCDFGPDLSRGFRALKTWFTLKVFGTDALGAVISNTCALARSLESRIVAQPELELLAPVELNIVCFRYRAASETEAQRINPEIVIELQESGMVAPSSTIIDGHFAIRAAIVNHRTTHKEIETLVERTLSIGRKLSSASAAQDAPPPPHLVRDAALRATEARLAANPARTDLRFEMACLLNECGRTGDARNAYLELLARDPSHRLALNNLGTLLYETGYRTAARTAYAEAVARHPEDPMSRVNLGNLLYESGDIEAARAQFEMALRFDPDHTGAHRGLAYVFDELNEPDRAEQHRRRGFENLPAIALPYRGEGPPVPLLLLVSAVGGNIPTRHLLDDRVFRTFVVTPDFYDPHQPLPPHRIVFNAIGDADLAASSLAAARSLLSLTNAPLINHPTAVLATGRADHAARLAGLQGVITPLTVTLPRELLTEPGTLERHGFHFPLLVRSPGFHTGRHFVKVDTPDDLAGAIADLPGAELTVIEFLNARGEDGKVRKYRVMMIDGTLYPLHLAISNDWKIHYFSADMAEDAVNRAEDAAFLEDMPRVLGPQAMDALAGIQATLGLDYAGIDFGLSPRGEVLLFEANATMVVNPPPAGEQWAYRRQAVERIFEAVRQMLLVSR
jgi:tetratricopeptide (TPR) repeat protein